MYENNGPIKKNNHVCPRCLLREWATTENGREGVFVYEIPKQKYSFSTAIGSRAYSFAIREFIYVPEIEGKRTIALEDWFAGFEGQLASFISKIKNGKEGEQLLRGRNIQDIMEQWNKLLLAIFSLHHRNAHDLRLITKYLDQNPHLKENIGVEDVSNTELLVLQNIVHSTMELGLEYQMCDFLVMHNPSGNILLSDRLLFQEHATGQFIFPLSPFHLIAISKSEGDVPSYRRDTLPDSMVDSYNKLIAGRARDWMVSTKEHLLKKYAPLMKAHDENEIPFYQEIKFLNQGIKFDPPKS